MAQSCHPPCGRAKGDEARSIRVPTTAAILGLVLFVAASRSSAQEASSWRMVSAYDASAIAAFEPRDGLSYLWTPAPGMEASCGPAKRAYGIGIFEAEAMASGMQPTLALVLERVSGPNGNVALASNDVRVSIGKDRPAHDLEPAVQPRHLAVDLRGKGRDATRYLQLLRTQLAIELCLEHKIGRAWTGHEAGRVREAFMLDPPTRNADLDGPGAAATTGPADRMYFGGQGDAVPALLGPPDACLVKDRGDGSPMTGAAGASSLGLVPSDVWSASLRWCSDDEAPGTKLRDWAGALPLKLGVYNAPTTPSDGFAWSALEIDVEAAEDIAAVRLLLRLDGRILHDGALFEELPRSAAEQARGRGLVDILSRVPRALPRIGPVDDPARYTVLLVPNWQIVQALDRLDPPTSAQEALDRSKAIRDGVGHVLAHPELLHVQVRSGQAADARWLDLGGALRPGTLSSRHWGYATGFATGRSPIILPGDRAPTWKQASAAQRARPQALFLLAFGVALAALWRGAQRLSNLWTKVPEVPVDHWPGLAAITEEKKDHSPSANEVIEGNE